MNRLEWPENVTNVLTEIVRSILGLGARGLSHHASSCFYWGDDSDPTYPPYFWVLAPGDWNEVTKPDKVLFYGSWGDETQPWTQNALWLEYGPETPIDREAIEKLIREVQILAAE